MKNVRSMINEHNKKLLHHQKNVNDKCNCRNKNLCQLNGDCRSKSLIYKATVSSNNHTETYVGPTKGEFKFRYHNHIASFKNINKHKSTELRKYIWTLKDKNIDYIMQWRILKHAQPRSKNSPLCHLCLWEKYFIVFKPRYASLNTRSDFISTFRHARAFFLESITWAFYNPYNMLTSLF